MNSSFLVFEFFAIVDLHVVRFLLTAWRRTAKNDCSASSHPYQGCRVGDAEELPTVSRYRLQLMQPLGGIFHEISLMTVLSGEYRCLFA
jgi:hypothetical protein